MLMNTKTVRALAVWVILSHVGALVAPAFANPEGGAVASGTANISSSGAVVTIDQSTDKAVINWSSFSNAAGETVRFRQPGATSTTLNRVTGLTPSAINGALQANGRVFLLNPNGIVFGKTATVNVGGLVASTLKMSDADFNAGKYNLEHGAGSGRAVVNQGQINADQGVALVAPIVDNQGKIVGGLGQVVLAGTSKATVNFDQNGLVNVVVPSGRGDRRDVEVGDDSVSNVMMDAAAAQGVVEAGEITRTADGRTIFKNAEGIAINSGSIVARTAAGNGGQVRVVGTQAAILARGSTIDASGVGRGQGGDVRVLSGGTAASLRGSSVTARGGDEGGDGGFIEISGPKLIANGTADASAKNGGKSGTLLLDPADIVILNGCAGTGGNDCQLCDFQVLACNGAGTFVLTDGQINAISATGGDQAIVIEATGSIVFDGSSNGAFDIALSDNDSIRFTVTGTTGKNTGATGGCNGNAIDVIGNGTLTASGAIRFESLASDPCGTVNGGQTIDLSGMTVSFGAGGFFASAGTAFSSTSNILTGTNGNVCLTATRGVFVNNVGTVDGNINIQNTILAASGISLGGTISARNGDITVTSLENIALGFSGGVVLGRNVTLTALNLNVSGGILDGNGALTNIAASNAINLTALNGGGICGQFNAPVVNGAAACANVVLGNNLTGTALRVTSTGDINGNGGCAINISAATIDLRAAGSIGNTNVVRTNAGTLNATAGSAETLTGSIDIREANAVTLGTVTAGANVTIILTGSGAMTLGSACSGIVSGDNVALQTFGCAGDDILDGHADDGAGNFTNVAAFNSIFLSAGASGNLGTGAALIETTNANVTTIACSVNVAQNAVTTLGAVTGCGFFGTVSLHSPGSVIGGCGVLIHLDANLAAVRVASGSIGTIATPLSTALSRFAAKSGGTTGDDIAINNNTGVILNLVCAGAADVSIRAAGGIADGNDGGTADAPGVVNIVANAASLIATCNEIGQAGNRLETTINSLKVDNGGAAGAGDAFLAESDGLTLDTVRVSNNFKLRANGLVNQSVTNVLVATGAVFNVGAANDIGEIAGNGPINAQLGSLAINDGAGGAGANLALFTVPNGLQIGSAVDGGVNVSDFRVTTTCGGAFTDGGTSSATGFRGAFTLTAATAGAAAATSVGSAGDRLDMNATTFTVGQCATANPAAGAQAVFVAEDDGLTLVRTAVFDAFDLLSANTASVAGENVAGNTDLSANTATFTVATGNVGTCSASLQTNVNGLVVNGATSLFVRNNVNAAANDALALNGVTVTGTAQIVTEGALTSTGLAAGSVLLSTDGAANGAAHDIGAAGARFQLTSSSLAIAQGCTNGAANAFLNHTGGTQFFGIRVTNRFDYLGTGSVTTGCGALVSATEALFNVGTTNNVGCIAAPLSTQLVRLAINGGAGVRGASDAFLSELDGIQIGSATDGAVHVASMTLNTVNGGTITDGGATSANGFIGNLTLTASNATAGANTCIGSCADRFNTAGGILSVRSSAAANPTIGAQNAFVESDGAISLRRVAVGGTFNLLTNAVGSVTGEGLAGATDLAAATAIFNLNNANLCLQTNVDSLAVTGTVGSLTVVNNAAAGQTDGLILNGVTVTGCATIRTEGNLTTAAATSLTAATASLSANAACDAATHDIGAACARFSTDVATLSITGANNAFVNEASGVALGASSVQATYNLLAAGAVTDATGCGRVAAGTLAINVGANDIGAACAPLRTFVTTLAINDGAAGNGANNLFVSELDAVALSTLRTAASATVTAGGAITETGGVVTPTLTLTSGADIGTAGDPFDTTLTTLAVTGAVNATIRESDALVVNGVNVTTLLTLSTAGALTDTAGNGLSGGTADLNVGAANDIGSAANRFNTNLTGLSIRSGGAAGAASAFITEANALSLGVVRVGATFDYTGNGALTDGAGSVLAATTAQLRVGTANDIGSAANRLDTAVTTLAVDSCGAGGASSAFFNQAGGVVVDGVVVGGTFDLLASGNIVDNAGCGVTATTVALASGAGADVGNAANRFNTTATTLTVCAGGATGAANAFVTETDGLVLANVRVGSVFDLAAGGAISDSGALGLAAGTAVFNVGLNDIGSAANRLDTTLGALTIANGTANGASNAFLNETDAVTLQNVRVAGAFDLAANGSITDGTVGLFAPTAVLSAGATGDIGSAANPLDTAVQFLTVGAAANAFVNEADALVVNGLRFGNTLSLTAGGAISDSGANGLFGGSATIAAGTSDVGSAANPLDTALASLNVASAGNLVINEADALGLFAINVATFSITALGSISDAQDNGNNLVTNLVSSGAGRLVSAGTIGSVLNGIEAQMGGALTVNIGGTEAGASGAFIGTIAGGVNVEAAPGLVFFNGNPVNAANVAVGVVTAANQAANAAIAANAATVAGTLASELINVAETFDGEEGTGDEGNAAGAGSSTKSTSSGKSGPGEAAPSDAGAAASGATSDAAQAEGSGEGRGRRRARSTRRAGGNRQATTR